MVAFLILVILFLLISGVLGKQIANESVLALRVKQFLYLEQPYSKKLLAFSRFKTWWGLMPHLFVAVFPLICVVVLALKLHHFLSDLLDCPMCTSFHIMWMLLFFFMGLPIITSLVFAPLGILGVYIIDGIRK